MTTFSVPRPGGAASTTHDPIPGPSEEAFVAVFGAVLAPARYLTTPYGRAAYYEVSTPSAQQTTRDPNNVLFIHGVQTPAIGMVALAKALHESSVHSRFVLLDLWGHGLSDTPAVPHEPSLFFALIDAVFTELDWPSAHLVGYSFGGALAVGYTLSRPSRVQSFALIAPAGLISSSILSDADKSQLNNPHELDAQRWVYSWLEGGALTVPQDWQQRVADGQIVAEAVKEWQIRNHNGHMASVLAIIRDGGVFDRDADFSQAATQTTIPACVIVGQNDGFSRKQDLGRVGFQNIFEVQGAGHGLVRDNVDAVASLIEKFWKSLP